MIQPAVPRRTVYETAATGLEAEANRLRSFDTPTRSSVEAIGDLGTRALVVDVGAGENPNLRQYVVANSGRYMAIDVRRSALIEQKHGGAWAVEGDARHLPVRSKVANVVHARFLLAHLPEDERPEVIRSLFGAVKPGGRATFIDYDWHKVDGSPAMQDLRDFTLNEIQIFDAGFGAKAFGEITHSLNYQATIAENRTVSPLMHDYAPALGLRNVTLAALASRRAGLTLEARANTIFDRLHNEAAGSNPPGYHMPDIVAVTASKPA